MVVYCRHVDCAKRPAFANEKLHEDHIVQVHMVPRRLAPTYLMRGGDKY